MLCKPIYYQVGNIAIHHFPSQKALSKKKNSNTLWKQYCLWSIYFIQITKLLVDRCVNLLGGQMCQPCCGTNVSTFWGDKHIFWGINWLTFLRDKQVDLFGGQTGWPFGGTNRLTFWGTNRLTFWGTNTLTFLRDKHVDLFVRQTFQPFGGQICSPFWGTNI